MRPPFFVRRRRSSEQSAGEKTAGPGGKTRREIRPHHVERAVGEIDEIHDAEDERQPGGEQEQQQAELQAVQALFDQEQHQWSVRSRASEARRQKPGAMFPNPDFRLLTPGITISSGTWRGTDPGCP